MNESSYVHWDFLLTTYLFDFISLVDSIGISDDLKAKLKDVLIQEQQFTLGRMLGKGKCEPKPSLNS